jgi:DNA modification methylase
MGQATEPPEYQLFNFKGQRMRITAAKRAESAFDVNKLILGDNLDVLKTLPDGCVDLIYLDPPFFSNKKYEVIWGDGGEIRSFEDRWAGGIDHYIAWLKERVEQMHRVLKPSGSLFLHCDWHANAYIRVHILDKIFGEKNFKNEIIWSYKRYTAASKKFQNLHDTIFYYSKSDNYTFNEAREDYGQNSGTMDSHYKQDEDGQWFRWQKRKGQEPYKIYLSEGRRIGDVWEIPIINASSKERIGYPTQKPEALLERIIKCASNEGDIVLDPFMGGGTTLAVADKLNRRWLGIDQSPMAVKVTDIRLQKQTDFFTAPYTVQLHKYDYDTLRYKDAFEFESWIITQYGGTANIKQRGDLGLDGKMGDNTPIQVKRSDNIGRSVIDNFLSAVQRYDKNLFQENKKAKQPVGYIIAFSFGKGAVGEVARLRNEENIIIKLVKVDEIVDVAAKPVVNIKIKELERDAKGNRTIEFTASGENGAGVEFYSWDFEYDSERGFKASVVMDPKGRQIIPLKAGTHNIAVMIVDNDGLENIEVVRLRLNGKVKREG